MPQSLSKILLHIVFSTKYREKSILPEYQEPLFAYIATVCRSLGSQSYRIGGIDDHIHAACSLPRTITVAKLVEKVKIASSIWIKEEFKATEFSWQGGYAAFSLGQSQLNRILKYIEGQKDHHRKKTYKGEVIQLLKLYGMEYDERYLWD